MRRLIGIIGSRHYIFDSDWIIIHYVVFFKSFLFVSRFFYLKFLETPMIKFATTKLNF